MSSKIVFGASKTHVLSPLTLLVEFAVFQTRFWVIFAPFLDHFWSIFWTFLATLSQCFVRLVLSVDQNCFTQFQLDF